MVTLKDIAKHVGISVSATSMALRNDASIGEETKKRVREAKEALGYRMKGKPSGSIAFVLFDRGFSEVYARSFQSIGELAIKHDLHPIYLSLDSAAFASGKLPPVFQKRNVDGIIVSGVYEEATHQRLRELGIPIVALGNYQLGVDPWAACEVDLSGGIRLTLSVLHNLGHRSVGLLMGTSEKRPYGRQVRQIYLNSLAEFSMISRGIQCEEDFRDQSEHPYLDAARALLKQENRPTALIMEKSSIAMYDECEKCGLKVPSDISIISLGRADYQMRPSMATVESDPAKMGQGAFEKLRRLIENPEGSLTRELFGMQLVPGDSIGPAPTPGN